MSLEHLEPTNTRLAQQIVDTAYTLVINEGTSLYGLAVAETVTPDVVGISGVCAEMSDATTRAAHALGVVASRELHHGHYLTSFNPLDQLPDENDTILCLTWGQFNPKAYIDRPTYFFGRRADIAPHVGSYYAETYSFLPKRKTTDCRPWFYAWVGKRDPNGR